MRSKLQTFQYANAGEFAEDMRLIFSNCYRYNPPGSDVFEAGKKLQGEFEQRYALLPDDEEVQYTVSGWVLARFEKEGACRTWIQGSLCAKFVLRGLKYYWARGGKRWWVTCRLPSSLSYFMRVQRLAGGRGEAHDHGARTR